MIHTIDLHFQGEENAIAAYLVETDEGPVLVETGPHSTFPVLKAGIEKIGYRVVDIRHVFLSHIHLDHAGCAWIFADHGALIYVHPFGVQHLADPSRLMASAKRIYEDKMDTLWGQMEPIDNTQLKQIGDGEMVHLGNTSFRAWHTPGHAVHHIAWQMGQVLFSGDVAGVKIENGLVVPPCPPPDINIVDWQNSIRKIKSLDLISIYLTHFGKVQNINHHLVKLEECLLDWANWIKPFWEDQVDIQKIIPSFEKYVTNQLLEAGVSKADIRKYEAANPAWMSVAGLMRYWTKTSVKSEK